jgi:multicomponent Na+:H+ antiporter subunit C
MIVTYAILAGVLAAVGTAQVLQRTLTRIVIGVVLIGQAANLLLLIAGGQPAGPPLVGAEGAVSDPLPQALALTAIVITFAIVSFLLGLAWRAARLTGEDRVEDDLEDRRIARLRDEEERVAARLEPPVERQRP